MTRIGTDVAQFRRDHLGKPFLVDPAGERRTAHEAFSSGSKDADAFFFATGLPIANAVIHYRTPAENLTRAREWARRRWPDEEDPSVALATFTLIYMIAEGWKRYSRIAEKKPLWDRIRAHVAALAAEPTPATAA